MDDLVEFLFKYRPALFENGHLALDASVATVVAGGVITVMALVAIMTYARVHTLGMRDRRVLAGMRALLVVLLAFMLLRPVLVVSQAFGKLNVVGLVVDDSRSMQVADMAEGRTRADVVRSLVGGRDSALYRVLAERFTVQVFRVGGNGTRVAGSVDALRFDASATHLAAALEGTRQGLSGAPLAGLVLVSDGADNAPDELSETLRRLQSRRLPVYTIGVGQPQFSKDVEISRVEALRTVIQGSAVAMNVVIVQRGLGGTTVPVMVEDSGRVVGMERVTLPQDGEATTVRLRVRTPAAGARRFTVRVPVQLGEVVTENNTRTAMVLVRGRREKVLYVEGEPRAEFVFLRRALAEDATLQLVSLVRTAKGKFLRLGVDDTLELANGFPATHEELFAYRGLVLGNIEAGFFSPEQLQMIADFVSERGGGFLMLGGRDSFAEGGYAKTVLAGVLPVVLPEDKTSPLFQKMKVRLTSFGAVNPVVQIAPSDSASARRWKGMPELSTVNRIEGAKPGASTLLVGAEPGGQENTVVLAYQRYGVGTAFAFPVQDSWLWKMDPGIAPEDETYTVFWRQILRTLVNDVPRRVTAIMQDQVAPGEPWRLSADVVDERYRKVNNAEVVATVVAPSGVVAIVPLEWSGIHDGEYRATYLAAEHGVHRVQMMAQMRTESGRDTVLSNPAFVDVSVPNTEFIGAQLHAPLLQRVAEETGGQYHTPASALAIAEELAYSQNDKIPPERLDLWDMPALLLGLLLLVSGEWSYRRARGLC